jgi:hypothetical protein
MAPRDGKPSTVRGHRLERDFNPMARAQRNERVELHRMVRDQPQAVVFTPPTRRATFFPANARELSADPLNFIVNAHRDYYIDPQMVNPPPWLEQSAVKASSNNTKVPGPPVSGPGPDCDCLRPMRQQIS